MLYMLKFKGQIRLLLNHGCILSSPTWIPDLSSHISIFDVLCDCALTRLCSFATFRKAGECCTFFPILSKIQMASFWFAMPRMSSVLFRAHLALCSRLNKGFKISFVQHCFSWQRMSELCPECLSSPQDRAAAPWTDKWSFLLWGCSPRELLSIIWALEVHLYSQFLSHENSLFFCSANKKGPRNYLQRGGENPYIKRWEKSLTLLQAPQSLQSMWICSHLSSACWRRL